MSKNILIDSGFWIALFTVDDSRHDEAMILDEILMGHRQIIPWPSLYEFLNTKFLKYPMRLVSFKKRILQPNIIRLSDEFYRDDALSKFLELDKYSRRLSLIDLVIREILMDEKAKIDTMVTFNVKDFVDLCGKRKIELIGN